MPARQAIGPRVVRPDPLVVEAFVLAVCIPVTPDITQQPPHHVVHRGPSETAPHEGAGEPPALHLRREVAKRAKSTLGRRQAEGDLVHRLLMGDLPDGLLDRRALDALAQERLPHAPGALAALEATGRLSTGDRCIVEQPQRLEPIENARDQIGVGLVLGEPPRELPPRTPGAPQCGKGAIERGRIGMRLLERHDLALVQRHALA